MGERLQTIKALTKALFPNPVLKNMSRVPYDLMHQVLCEVGYEGGNLPLYRYKNDAEIGYELRRKIDARLIGLIHGRLVKNIGGVPSEFQDERSFEGFQNTIAAFCKRVRGDFVDIAAASNVPPSVVYRTIGVMEDIGFVKRSPQKRDEDLPSLYLSKNIDPLLT